MADVDDFVAHPRTFLRHNVLIVSAETGGVGGVKTFKFTQVNSMTAKNMLVSGNPPMRVFSLSLLQGKPGVDVRAYWCPYAGSSALGTTLPGVGGPDMMFTYAMDGCTFVAGSRTTMHDVSVYHVNMTAQTNQKLDPSVAGQQQRKIQKNVAKGLVTNPQMIDPDDYYDPASRNAPVPPDAKLATVTFGRRASGGEWKFYIHQYYTVPGNRTTLCYIGCERCI
jgi:hypothetical protein